MYVEICKRSAEALPEHLFPNLPRHLNNSMPLITTQDRIFELQPGETLLEGLERTGHEVEYQCRSGYCGSCRLKLLAGNVSYPQYPLAFVGPNEVLPCCCKVEGDIAVAAVTRRREPDLFDEDLFD